MRTRGVTAPLGRFFVRDKRGTQTSRRRCGSKPLELGGLLSVPPYLLPSGTQEAHDRRCAVGAGLRAANPPCSRASPGSLPSLPARRRSPPAAPRASQRAGGARRRRCCGRGLLRPLLGRARGGARGQGRGARRVPASGRRCHSRDPLPPAAPRGSAAAFPALCRGGTASLRPGGYQVRRRPALPCPRRHLRGAAGPPGGGGPAGSFLLRGAGEGGRLLWCRAAPHPLR